MTKETKKPTCKLVGTDGNVFAIIAHVGSALKKAGLHEQAIEWKTKAVQQHSYDDVLCLLYDYVEVE